MIKTKMMNLPFILNINCDISFLFYNNLLTDFRTVYAMLNYNRIVITNSKVVVYSIAGIIQNSDYLKNEIMKYTPSGH